MFGRVVWIFVKIREKKCMLNNSWRYYWKNLWKNIWRNRCVSSWKILWISPWIILWRNSPSPRTLKDCLRISFEVIAGVIGIIIEEPKKVFLCTNTWKNFWRQKDNLEPGGILGGIIEEFIGSMSAEIIENMLEQMKKELFPLNLWKHYFKKNCRHIDRNSWINFKRHL